MIGFPPSIRIFICSQPTDMRRSFDSLARMVEDVLKLDPFSGYLFLFRSRRGDRIKALYWDDDGFAIWYKRLEKGVFTFPDATHGEISSTELTMILKGVDVASLRYKKRFKRER